MLIGDRVQLRGIERADLPTFVRWMNDPAIRGLIARSSPLSMAEEERWFDALLKSTTDVVFAIQTGSPARMIGSCGLHKIDWKNRNCAVGIVIGADADRGHGLGTDAMACLLRHAFDDLGLYRVELEVFPDNAAALASYTRCGFVVEGTRRGAIFKKGAFKDLVLMSVLASARKPAPGKAKKRKA